MTALPIAPENTGDEQVRGQDGKFRPGQSGNPRGRPRRARSRSTEIAEQLLDGDAEAIVSKAIDMAKKGDGPVLRALLALIVPPQRARPMLFEFPRLREAGDVMKTFDAIAEALARGDLSEPEMKTLVAYLETFLSALNAVDYEARLAALEERMKEKKR